MAAKMGGRGGARPGSGPKPMPREKTRRNRVVMLFTDAEFAALENASKGQMPNAFAREIILRYLARRRK